MMPRFFSGTLAQILAIVACSMLATLVLFFCLVFAQNTAPARRPWPWPVAHRIISLVHLLEEISPEHRDRASLLAAAQQPDLTVAMRATTPACTGSSLDARILEAALRAELRNFPTMTVAACPGAATATAIQVRVPIGPSTLDVRTGRISSRWVNFNTPTFNVFLFMFISTIALSAWAVWRVVRPMRRLSRRAEAFGRELSPAPIQPEGPEEMRNLAHTFNLMQERIARSVDERTRMLAAISHDLRTPLTRMRLQVDVADGEVDRDKLRRNIDQMQAMLGSALAFLGHGHDGEDPEWLDLDALLSTLCDEYAEAGQAVRYEGPGQIRFHGRLNALTRAIGNLIDNAIHFGGTAIVAASVDADGVQVDVLDDGPGIPPAQLQEVLEPFVRLDASRNDRPGSLGLGLSIVSEIVGAHGGTLVLANRESGGLKARITFPHHDRPSQGRL